MLDAVALRELLEKNGRACGQAWSRQRTRIVAADLGDIGFTSRMSFLLVRGVHWRPAPR